MKSHSLTIKEKILISLEEPRKSSTGLVGGFISILVGNKILRSLK